eukprot:476640_1
MLREFCNQQTDMDMQAAHVPLVHCYSGVISIIRMDGMVMSFKYNEMNELYCLSALRIHIRIQSENGNCNVSAITIPILLIPLSSRPFHCFLHWIHSSRHL